MNASCLTVVTPTLGDSGGRLEHLCAELRRFSDMPFRQIICDDGTIDEESKRKQRVIADRHGIVYLENPGPYGISFNLNHAFSSVGTPWAFLIEDGVRPSQGWLEAAVEFIDKIGERYWGPCGREVGMAGCTSVQDWMLALAGAIPSHHPVMEWYRNHEGTIHDHFYGPWNDGYWCWNRMLPGLRRSCLSPGVMPHGEPNNFTEEVAVFRDLLRQGLDDPSRLAHWQTGQPFHESDIEQIKLKFRTQDHWPVRRTAGCGWYPGALLIINMDAWRKVGQFREGCTFFEAHLGLRMGLKGYVSLCLEFPPFLHQPSQGFSTTWQAKNPRIHYGTTEVFEADFGANHLDAPRVANAVVSLEEQMQINAEVAKHPLSVTRGWERWMEV